MAKEPGDDEIHYHGGRKTKGDAWFLFGVLCWAVLMPVLYVVLSILRFLGVI